MKSPLAELPVQYIYDETGKKTGVFMNIKGFEKLVEDLEDMYLSMKALKALNDETEVISFEEVNRLLDLNDDE